VNVKIFIENYQIPFSTVSVRTGVGPLQAQVVIPPGEYRRKILPGSRVNAFMQSHETEWKWVWWFRGYTTNFPDQAIGMDESPIVLNVVSELQVLGSTLMKYLLLGQQDSSDLKVRENFLAGSVGLNKSSPQDMFSPFSNLSETSIGFGGRILGIVQAMLSMNPQVWEQARRSRVLDYLLIETNDSIAEGLDKAVVMSAVTNVLAQIQQPEFSGMDILVTILQYIFHDLCSVAPMRYCGAGVFKSPVRDNYGYMPKLEWWNLPDVGQSSLINAFCDMDLTQNKLFDHIIKPSFENGSPLFAENDIDMDDYSTAYMQEVGNTRTIAKFPFMLQVGKPQSIEDVSAPGHVEDAYRLSLDLVQTLKEKDNVFIKGNLFAERITGIRTNEERVINKVISRTITADPRITTMLYAIGTNTPGTPNEIRERQEKYLRQYVHFEHDQSRGITLSIPNAVYNPKIIPGFYCYVHGNKGELYFGKIVGKVDTYDLSGQVCSSSYEIERCIKQSAYDFNSVKADADFLTLNGTFEKISAGVEYHPVLGGLPEETKEAFRSNIEYVPYQRALAHLGLRDDSGSAKVLESEERKPKEWPKDDPKKPYFAEVMDKENFYSALDCIPIEADSIIKGIPSNLQIEPNNLVDIRTHIMESGIDARDAIMFLDAKIANYFSFTSILTNSRMPLNDATLEHGVLYLKNQKLNHLPIWEGNPCAQRVDLLLHYLSMMNSSEWADFLDEGIVPKHLKTATIPRPISDRQLIALRRAMVEAAFNER
jgi:hypothetical protein